MKNSYNIKFIINLVERALDIKKGKLSSTDSSETVENWDSLAIINIIIAFESQLSIKFEIDDYSKFSSIKEINKIFTKKKIFINEKKK